MPMPVISAALLYFGIVFGIGFLLGPVRVIWLEPRLGAVLANLCEAPFLIIAMVLAARSIPKMVGLARDLPALLAMGVGALILQQIADFAVGIGLRDLTLSEQLAHFATTQGFIYGVLLILFCLMPVLLNRNKARTPRP
jgi:hypothetical protein